MPDPFHIMRKGIEGYHEPGKSINDTRECREFPFSSLIILHEIGSLDIRPTILVLDDEINFPLESLTNIDLIPSGYEFIINNPNSSPNYNML